MDKKIEDKLKTGSPEQTLVVGPTIERLIKYGWVLEQIVFGKNEWKIPKTPSEATKRECGRSFDYFPADIAVFESPETVGDYRHLLFIIECKQPDIDAGLSQLETYLSLEPHVKMGIWTNSADDSAENLFVYKSSEGLQYPKRKTNKDMPSVGAKLNSSAFKLTFDDLVIPTKDTLYKTFSELLDSVVAHDGNVTRREEQLDQLCNLILLKLDSDKEGKIDNTAELNFRSFATDKLTAKFIKRMFSDFITIYPDVFITKSDQEIRFDDSTIHEIVEKMSSFNFIDVGPETVSIAFQVLRSAALKQEEGQYFTPKQVIQAAVKLMNLSLNDIIIDPACGTGGFLIQCLTEIKEKYPTKEKEVSRWAQLHLFGIDKDSIGIKLTKAIMQILGDGSAHCVRGDSVLTHTWSEKYPHFLTNNFQNNRFNKIFTNPPFGASLKIKFSDAKKSGLSITEEVENNKDIELGLAMFNRCCDLLKVGGRMCIVLPETYFFSPSYEYVRNWAKKKLRPVAVVNVPMEAFQGFCRAKTNLYIFEKIDENKKFDVKKYDVLMLNPQTCGIYKNGGDRFVVDAKGNRTNVIDNQLLECALSVEAKNPIMATKVSLEQIYLNNVIVPKYYDHSLQNPFEMLCKKNKLNGISIGELCDKKIVKVFGGHGSPSNDMRNGSIPYVKVSDIRNMRINVNPTNLITIDLAKKYWRDDNSNLHEWDLISPSRASSNIGEFAILVPGEEQIVLTKEVFVVRALKNDYGISPFYLLWALSLIEIRMQWQRVTLMQTNREDVGNRYREIMIPMPPNEKWAETVSDPFKKYFTGLAAAKKEFVKSTSKDRYTYIASVSAFENEK